MNGKDRFFLLGAALFGWAFIGVFLAIVGIKLFPFGLLYRFGGVFALVLELLCMVVGIVIMLVAKTDWEKEKNESR
jgi:hypothetical protein